MSIKFRTCISIILSLVMLFSIAFAEEVEDASVEILPEEEDMTVGQLTTDLLIGIGGSINVEQEEEAVGVQIRQDSGSTEKTDLKVDGDVSVKATGETSTAVAVEVEADTIATVLGSVSAEAETAADAVVIDTNNDALVMVSVDQGISADAHEGTATAVKIEADDDATVAIQVGNDGVAAFGADATAVEIETHGGDVALIVDGDVTAEATDTATGIEIITDDGTAIVDVIGEVSAYTEEEEGIAVAACLDAGDDGNIYLAADEIKAEASEDIEVFQATALEVATTGGDVIVETSVITSDNVGIVLDAEGGNVDILADDYIYGQDVAILVENADADIGITAWQIDPNESGNVVEAADESKAAEAEDIQKNIMYIIKVDQPDEGGYIQVTDQAGQELMKSHGFDVAKEDDVVLLRIDVDQGYKVTDAYNDAGFKVPLVQDENGNYYIVVPRGGGVYLSATLTKLPDEEQLRKEANPNQDTIQKPQVTDTQPPQVKNPERQHKDAPIDIIDKTTMANRILTIKDATRKTAITFFDNGMFVATEKHTARNGRFELDNGQIVLIDSDDAETVIEPDGDAFRLTYNSCEFEIDAAAYQVLVMSRS